MWDIDNEMLNPDVVLRSSHERADVVQGLVPQRGIAWLYGASMSYKTFAAMSMAVRVSQGQPWVGRKTEVAAVIYLGAEGGAALHLRRAAAEVDVGSAGPLFIVQERPQLDTPQGAARLRGIIRGITGVACDGSDGDIELETLEDGAAARYDTGTEFQDDMWDKSGACAVLCVIDTYSQTSSGDDKTNVSAYIKALRDVIETADLPVAFLVVDHATKAGGSYMGSVAKLNDVDSQLEVLRTGDNRATLYQRKVKDGVESAPLQIEMVPHVLERYRDAYGAPLATLVVRDGGRAGRPAEGKAAILLSILKAREDGVMRDAELREGFAAHASNGGIKSESIGKAYRRAKDSLIDVGLIAEEGGEVHLV